MSLLTKAGISKLSELEIDAAPAQAKDIVELILTAQGDILYRNVEAARLAADYGTGYNFLKIQNTGVEQPCWVDLQAIIIWMTGALNRMIQPPTLLIPVPDLGLDVAEDHSGGAHVASSELPILVVPSIALTAPSYQTPVAVGGAVCEDGGVQTDETAKANDAVANDMRLVPWEVNQCKSYNADTPAYTDEKADINNAIVDDVALPPLQVTAAGDAIYFGSDSIFNRIRLNVSTVGVYSDITISWEYYDDVAVGWEALEVTDNTNSFKNAGVNEITFTPPANWGKTTVDGVNVYWVRAVTSFGASPAITTAPLGAQAWLPKTGDAYYFGMTNPWDWLSLNIGTPGSGTWTVTWEYYDGADWVSLPDTHDTSDGFRNGNHRSITFSRPGDWGVASVGGIANKYWIRGKISAYTNISQLPLGTQAWIGTH